MGFRDKKPGFSLYNAIEMALALGHENSDMLVLITFTDLPQYLPVL